VSIAFDEPLVDHTRELLRQMREMATSGVLPPPLEDSPKCPRCSLVGICLPDETCLLKEQDKADSGEVRRLMPARDDALPFYIQEQGVTLGKSGEVLTVKRRQEVIQSVKLKDVSQISLLGNVQVSAQALREISAAGIPLCHFSYGGWFHAMTTGLVHKNIELRMAQFRTAADSAQSLRLARQIVLGKIRNGRTLLRRHLADDSRDALRRLDDLAGKAEAAGDMASLLGVEGMAGKVYFEGFATLLHGDAVFDFESRSVYLGYSAGGRGSYNLSSSGQLTATTEYVGDSGTGSFTQSSGTNSITNNLYLGGLSRSSGTYNLSGIGQLSAVNEYVDYIAGATALLQQTGGVNSASLLSIGNSGSYVLGGGTLQINGVVNQGVFAGGGMPAALVCNGILDLSSGSWQNLSSVNASMPVNSLLILPASGNPSTGFATFSTLGMTHTLGTTLTIAPGQGFGGSGSISDPVNCQGTISGGNLNLSGPLTLSGTASVSLGTGNLTTNDVLSGITGGSLSVANHYMGNFGTGAFTQSGGVYSIRTSLCVGNYLNSSGTYNLSGSGLLSSVDENVGYSGSGAFVQSAGTNSCTNLLALSTFAGSSGTYNLSGTGLLSASWVSVGGDGNGNFTQTGGTNNVSTVLFVGAGPGQSGAYNLSGTGQLSAPTEDVGNSGAGSASTGNFMQTGGSNGVTTNLYLGNNTGNRGNYVLSSGLLTAPSEGVGCNGTGVFTQTGGTHSVSQALSIGEYYSGSGTYNLSGSGMLSVYSEGLGVSGTGVFTQTGGTHSISYRLNLGNSYGSGTYNLSGGQLSVLNEGVGFYEGTGNFTQSGGTHNVGNALYLGENAGSNGTYNLNGTAILSASAEYIGYSGTGAFTQSAGTNDIANGIYLANLTGSNGTYNLTGGVLALSSLGQGSGTAAFNFNGGTLQASSSFSTSMPMTLGTSGGATFDTAGFAVTLSGSLSGSGNLTKMDGGTLILAASNNYSGGTTVNGGTLQVANAGALGSGGLVINVGLVNLNSFSIGVPSLGGTAGVISDLSNTGTGITTLCVNQSSNTTFGGTIQDGPQKLLALCKNGTGGLALTGSNTYSGPTTINQGKLVVDGWLTNSAVSVNGGTLGGSGYLSSVTVSPSGQLAPGDTSTGTLNVSGNVNLALGAVLDYDLDTPTTSDMISCGSLTLNSQQFTDFNFTPTTNFEPGIYNLIDFGSSSGSLGSTTSGTIDGLAATLTLQSNSLVLNVVPEPATLTLLGSAVLGLGVVYLRRRVKA
ncbi:MAG: CRISPR-associated endonuclease Cas1, partial [Thermoguttaceae bacterium]